MAVYLPADVWSVVSEFLLPTQPTEFVAVCRQLTSLEVALRSHRLHNCTETLISLIPGLTIKKLVVKKNARAIIQWLSSRDVHVEELVVDVDQVVPLSEQDTIAPSVSGLTFTYFPSSSKSMPLPASAVERVVKMCPLISELDCWSCAAAFSAEGFAHLVQIPTELNYISMPQSSSLSVDQLVELPLRHAETLTALDAASLDTAGFEKLSESVHNLVHLRISLDRVASAESIAALFLTNPGIVDVDIFNNLHGTTGAACPFNDDVATRIAEGCKALRFFELTFCPVTYACLPSFLEHCPQLEELDVPGLRVTFARRGDGARTCMVQLGPTITLAQAKEILALVRGAGLVVAGFDFMDLNPFAEDHGSYPTSDVELLQSLSECGEITRLLLEISESISANVIAGLLQANPRISMLYFKVHADPGNLTTFYAALGQGLVLDNIRDFSIQFAKQLPSSVVKSLLHRLPAEIKRLGFPGCSQLSADVALEAFELLPNLQSLNMMRTQTTYDKIPSHLKPRVCV